MSKFIFIIGLLLIGFSCSNEEFSVSKVQENSSTPGINDFTQSACTNFSIEKPKVDFLFLWDNSTSQVYLNSQVKAGLNNLINSISDQFDFRALSAALFNSAGIPATGFQNTFLVTNNPSNLSSTGFGLLIPQDRAASRLDSFPIVGGSNERGLSRASELVRIGYSNNIFRKNAYNIIVLMSNGDDFRTFSDGSYNSIQTNQYIQDQYSNLLFYRDNLLRSQQMRFMSLVAHSSCGQGARRGNSYINMSNLLYSSAPAFGTTPTDQSGKSTPDSYDLCSFRNDYSFIFEGINNSIQQQLVKHRYDHWLVASPDAATFDPASIQVRKSNGQFIPESTSNGWQYLTNPGTNNILTRNSRYLPTPGEPITGHIIKLYGNARITYPECLTVTTSSPTDFYNHVVLNTEPDESSITLKISGQVIPKSSTNGWQYIGFRSQQNIKTTGQPILKTGYFLRLTGSAIYSNGAKINVTYLPKR